MRERIGKSSSLGFLVSASTFFRYHSASSKLFISNCALFLVSLLLHSTGRYSTNRMIHFSCCHAIGYNSTNQMPLSLPPFSLQGVILTYECSCAIRLPYLELQRNSLHATNGASKTILLCLYSVSIISSHLHSANDRLSFPSSLTPPSFSPCLLSPPPPPSLPPLSPPLLPSSGACAAVNGSAYCNNRGDCYELASTHELVCVCRENSYGHICQYDPPDPCLNPNVCFGHGTCVHLKEERSRTFDCECFPGFESVGLCEYPAHVVGGRIPRCRPNYNYPDNNPCQNGGKCTHDIGIPRLYTCDCPPGTPNSSSTLSHLCVYTLVLTCVYTLVLNIYELTSDGVRVCCFLVAMVTGCQGIQVCIKWHSWTMHFAKCTVCICLL